MKTALRNNEQKGQSLIEFLMSITLVFGFLFLFFKVALNYTSGYVVHYTTFMAGRAFLVFERSDNNPNNANSAAETHAKTVYTNYKMRTITGPSGDFAVDSSDGRPAIEVGVASAYKTLFSFSSLLGGNNEMNFVSFARLGRSPSRAECKVRVCAMISQLNEVDKCDDYTTSVDNGC